LGVEGTESLPLHRLSALQEYNLFINVFNIISLMPCNLHFNASSLPL
jgi:hypothetical protein